MNILQVLPALNEGGVETGTLDLAKRLVRAGHRCVVVSSGGRLVRELEAFGIKHYALGVNNKWFPKMVLASRQLAKIIEEEDIQIVHARSRVPAWVAFMACRLKKVILITTAHGHYSRHIFSTIMGAGKYTIVPSSMIGRHMMEDFGVPLSNLRMIPRSVDLERYPFRGFQQGVKKEFIVGVVGRLTPIKGHVYFLKALAKLLRSTPYVKAWIIGGVSPGKEHYKEELEVWIRRLGLTGIVEFFGNRRDIPELLNRMDALVMPSIAQESFGRVIIEAQAIGVPVVATRVGGVVEIIDQGATGVLVDPRDHDGLCEGMHRILSERKFSNQIVENARRKVEEKFSLEKMVVSTLGVYREALESPRILVIKLGAAGDAILSIASLAALRSKFPAGKIVCLCGLAVADIFSRCPYIDELAVCDFKGRDKGIRAFWRLARQLLMRRFDLVVDLQNNKKSHLLSYLTLSHRRYGYKSGKWDFFMNLAIDGAKDLIGPVDHQFRVLAMLGVKRGDEELKMWLSEDDEDFAKNFLEAEFWVGDEKLVGINIGSSPRWHSKRWLPERFAKLCDELAKRDWRVLLTGAATDAALAQEILIHAKTKPICAVALTSLTQLAALIKRCHVYVTGDSAPMHVAAAVGVPFVALFGPTDHRRHLVKGKRCVVLAKGCEPCYRDRCPKKDHRCMRSISVEDVVRAVEGLIVH